MKRRGFQVELVQEYAKDLTYEERFSARRNQSHVFSEQARRQHRLVGKVDFAITDSPLLLSHVYAKGIHDVPGVHEWFEEVRNRYDNRNVLLLRNVPFQTYGRTSNEEIARRLDNKIACALTEYGRGEPLLVHMPTSFDTPQSLFERLDCEGLLS